MSDSLRRSVYMLGVVCWAAAAGAGTSHRVILHPEAKCSTADRSLDVVRNQLHDGIIIRNCTLQVIGTDISTATELLRRTCERLTGLQRAASCAKSDAHRQCPLHLGSVRSYAASYCGCSGVDGHGLMGIHAQRQHDGRLVGGRCFQREVTRAQYAQPRMRDSLSALQSWAYWRPELDLTS